VSELDWSCSVEKKEQALKKMMATVVKDKSMIQETIVELDRYKRDALLKTWEKVNGWVPHTTGRRKSGWLVAILGSSLASCYRATLPNYNRQRDRTLRKVSRSRFAWAVFGKHPSPSYRVVNGISDPLAEFPGSLDRSLIALSLIMSLLQFKPAPMYILDEIDAALDLQHTQHIGQLFKNRFKGSQFIVVSLKEGLFTNANVLFKARFRDGTSIVEVSIFFVVKGFELIC
jgi:structural maintenance of chromosome 2